MLIAKTIRWQECATKVCSTCWFTTSPIDFSLLLIQSPAHVSWAQEQRLKFTRSLRIQFAYWSARLTRGVLLITSPPLLIGMATLTNVWTSPSIYQAGSVEAQRGLESSLISQKHLIRSTIISYWLNYTTVASEELPRNGLLLTYQTDNNLYL